MKIALCYIVKDDSEVQKLKSSIDSAVDYVSSLHVVSNGQETSQIKDLIASYSSGNSHLTVTYDHLPWKKDFSEQRNFNFSKVPEDTDYILWLDTDDELVGGENLIKTAQKAKSKGIKTLFLEYWYGCTFDGEPSYKNLVDVDIMHYRERLIAPNTITWKKRIHETPVPIEGQRENYTKVSYKDSGVAVLHKNLIEDSYEKMDRNKALLELELADERKAGQPDPRTILYLMKIYAEIGDTQTLKETIELGYEYLSLSGWDEERANACDLMAICSSKLGDFNQATVFLHQAIAEYPHEPLHYVRLALAYFNLGKHDQCEHWINIASTMDIDDRSAGIKNLKELKVLFAQTLLKLNFNAKKDLKRSLEAAKLLYKEQPIEQNKQNLLYIQDLNDLHNASEKSKELIDYLESIDYSQTIETIDTLPSVIREQPWAVKKRQKLTPPRIWKENEICYFANFGGKHFEKWDLDSTKRGIGGSETAVIELSKQWAMQGYDVTIYGDPSEKQIKKYGDGSVTVLPWFHFNKGDKFNIFIQWRAAYLARHIKANKFIVDLHDVWTSTDYPDESINAIDLILVKSHYHKSLAGKEFLSKHSHKLKIIGNGIYV